MSNTTFRDHRCGNEDLLLNLSLVLSEHFARTPSEIRTRAMIFMPSSLAPCPSPIPHVDFSVRVIVVKSRKAFFSSTCSLPRFHEVQMNPWTCKMFAPRSYASLSRNLAEEIFPSFPPLFQIGAPTPTTTKFSFGTIFSVHHNSPRSFSFSSKWGSEKSARVGFPFSRADNFAQVFRSPLDFCEAIILRKCKTEQSADF